MMMQFAHFCFTVNLFYRQLENYPFTSLWRMLPLE